MLEILYAFLCAFTLSIVIISLFIKLFYKYDIVDNPKKYNKNRKPIPYSMGIVFFITFFITSFLFIEPNAKLYLIWGFGAVITCVSFFDDLFQVSAKKRLLIQIVIGAVIGVTSIKIGYISNIFGGILDLETYFFMLFSVKIFIIPLVFTIIWYVFIFNTINWTDGIGGNTSGLSAISFGILFMLGYILFLKDNYEGGKENAYFIMQMTSILIGILIPFWHKDIKEKILMGDSGTMFLGFMLATIAIISGGKVATVLVVFGIYSVDSIYVCVNRIIQKKNPLQGDFTHLHHRLAKIGLSNKNILSLLYSLSFFFGLTALFLDRTGKIIVFCIIIIIVIFINNIIEKFRK